MDNKHPVRIKTALGDDLLFRTMEGVEELGRPFLYELELLSPYNDLSLDAVLGHDACVELDLPYGGVRYFHGYCTRFALTGERGGYVTYGMELRPWLWFLTRTADCRIFQNKTVPEILAEIFREHGFSDFKNTLSRTYRTWEYCVQYRETDFDFVSRLMEQEGIYYFFAHEAGKHTLVLADSYGAHDSFDGYARIPYYPPSVDTMRDEHIYEWLVDKSVQPGKVVLRAYDFRKPKANLEVNLAVSRDHAQADHEIYDFPGEHLERNEGDAYVRARMEELDAQHERVRGTATARGIRAGALFSLTEFPRKDQNREYLVVSSRQSILLDAYESSEGEGLQYSCSFEAMDSRTPYRAPRVTPKPSVKGPQTAVVVGKAGEEIWTDEYGRVKVQFHWDRYGKADENSSCWVRVAQVWAGGNWGAMFIPRIGQEVIVDFIEGDPDRPIVTGRVYNADNMPPYGLPDEKTKSTLKSRSSKGGGRDNFNEIRFEDKKGKEEIYVHAERDMNRVVENNDVLKVGFSSLDGGSLRVLAMGEGCQQIEIRKDRTEKVGGNETITIGGSRTETVGKDESITISANRTESVGKDESISIGANRTETVGKDESITIGENRSTNIGKDESISVGKDRDEAVAGNEAVSIGKDRSVRVDGEDRLQVGKKLMIEAGDEIVLKTGSATLIMKKDGSITIKGKDVVVQASGKLGLKASSDVTIKGSKISQN